MMLQDREKHEQLHELLTGYSTNGLPPLPELLALGRPTFDESVFQMEAHWSILVDNASVNIVLFATSLCIHTAVHHSTLFYFLLQSFVKYPIAIRQFGHGDVVPLKGLLSKDTTVTLQAGKRTMLVQLPTDFVFQFQSLH